MNDTDLRDLLRLTLTPGIGPVLIGRLIERFGSARDAANATRAGLESIDKIGPKKADLIAEGLLHAIPLVEKELALADKLNIRFIAQSDPDYPPLLATIPQAPPLLSIRGQLDPQQADAFPVAIVGSRRCTAYGVEQAERFAAVLSSTGLTVVSGGARGIDTAAHRGALRAQGRTIAVLGCGLAQCYPPDNKQLFDQIVASGGAILSELPLLTQPDSSNFPARNRIISGIALGTLVIEATKRSGSLITARIAAEDHAREVMALPGRVDSIASQGSLHLIQQGGAALVVEPADVIQLLETPARHSFDGTHESRYVGETQLFETNNKPAEKPREIGSLSDAQRTILNAIQSPLTIDDLSTATGLSPETLRAEITMLEIQKRIVREGSRIAARSQHTR